MNKLILTNYQPESIINKISMTKTQKQKIKQSKIQKEKKIKHHDKSKPLNKTTLAHNWQKIQIQNYVLHLIAFEDQFKMSSLRDQIYEEMAQQVGNGKTFEQCHQFHIKNRKFFRGIDKVIKGFIKKSELDQQWLKKEAKKIKNEKDEVLKEIFKLDSEQKQQNLSQSYSSDSEKSAILKADPNRPILKRQNSQHQEMPQQLQQIDQTVQLQQTFEKNKESKVSIFLSSI